MSGEAFAELCVISIAVSIAKIAKTKHILRNIIFLLREQICTRTCVDFVLASVSDFFLEKRNAAAEDRFQQVIETSEFKREAKAS
jgi:hypothetical protein